MLERKEIPDYQRICEVLNKAIEKDNIGKAGPPEFEWLKPSTLSNFLSLFGIKY